MQGMELEAAKVAVASAKDTQLITLNKLLTPPELGSGRQSGSDSDAEAHLQPYALEHDAAGPAPGQQSGPAQGQSEVHAPSAATLASAPPRTLLRSSKATDGGQQQSHSAPTGTRQRMQPLQRRNAAMAQQDTAVAGHAAKASSAPALSPQQQQGWPEPPAPDEQDGRAAEAVLRSTLLPTQVSHAQTPNLQRCAHNCVFPSMGRYSTEIGHITKIGLSLTQAGTAGD